MNLNEALNEKAKELFNDMKQSDEFDSWTALEFEGLIFDINVYEEEDCNDLYRAVAYPVYLKKADYSVEIKLDNIYYVELSDE